MSASSLTTTVWPLKVAVTSVPALARAAASRPEGLDQGDRDVECG